MSVLEPYSVAPPLHSVSRHEVALGASAVVAVRVDGKTDVILHGLTDAEKRFTVAGHTFVVSAQTLVATFGTDEQLERLFYAGGPRAEIDGHLYHAPARASGRVSRIDPAREQVTVHLDEDNPFNPVEAAVLIGRTVRFTSPKGATAHTVKEAMLDGRELTITTQGRRAGRAVPGWHGERENRGDAHATGVRAIVCGDDRAR